VTIRKRAAGRNSQCRYYETTKKVVCLPPLVKKNHRPGLSSNVTECDPTNAPFVTVTGLPRSDFTVNPADFDSSSTANVQRPVLRDVTAFPFRLRLSFPALNTMPSSAPRNGTTSEPTMSCDVA